MAFDDRRLKSLAPQLDYLEIDVASGRQITDTQIRDMRGNDVTDDRSHRHLLSPLRIRNTTLPNRVIFGPVCPTWVRSPHEGIFTEQAVAYYEERAKTGLGMIILGGHLINKDTIYTPLGFPGPVERCPA